MRRLWIVLMAVALLGAPTPAAAWGFDAHKFIVEHALTLLPRELRPLFDANRAMVVERSIDPDTWQNLFDGHEDSYHFLDIDWEPYGPYPFTGLPRDYDEAVKKFGKADVDAKGRLPWRTQEIFEKLRESFAAYARRGSFGRWDILLYSAWLAHYVSDAHVPFHAVMNHDGQLTGQRGIHVRFEALMFERYRSQVRMRPTPLAPIRAPRDFIFDAVVQGTRLVPIVLEADRQAIGTRDVYDEAYFAAFFKGSREILERRLNESSAAVAAMIAGAWEAAGRPPVPVRAADSPQRRRP